ncbi:MAG: serine hydrolase [Bryobacteraceae bacterium]
MRAWILLMTVLPLLAQGPTAEFTRQRAIERKIAASIGRFQGKVSLFAKNLDTGESYSIRGDERVKTASTIKLPIMTAVFAAAAEGRVKLDGEVALDKVNKVSGSGVLTEMTDGTRLRLIDLVHLMIVVSDNTATNTVLDQVPGDYVNEYMEKLGLKDTRSLRKVLGSGSDVPRGVSKAGQVEDNKRFGIGVSTPREMVTLIEKIERGEVVSQEASKEMIEILKRQQYKDGIGRTLWALPVASKSGSLDHLRADVGIVYSPQGRIAIAITCDDIPNIDWSPDNPGYLLISRLTGFLIERLGNPEASKPAAKAP